MLLKFMSMWVLGDLTGESTRPPVLLPLRFHTYTLHSTETALEQTKPIIYNMTCYFTSCHRVSPVLDWGRGEGLRMVLNQVMGNTEAMRQHSLNATSHCKM